MKTLKKAHIHTPHTHLALCFIKPEKKQREILKETTDEQVELYVCVSTGEQDSVQTMTLSLGN